MTTVSPRNGALACALLVAITGLVQSAPILSRAGAGIPIIDTSRVSLTQEGDGAAANTTNPDVLPPAEAKRIIEGRSRLVLLALKGRNMSRLSIFVHPKDGVRFSPYNYVWPERNLIFKREKVRGLLEDKKKYLWGEYDGSGDPIRLTFASYYKKFIFDWDFSRTKRVSYNQAISISTNLDNAFTTYPGAIVVEYYHPGGKKYDGMDWGTLRLVFQKYSGMWYLVGIIHDEWTI